MFKKIFRKKVIPAFFLVFLSFFSGFHYQKAYAVTQEGLHIPVLSTPTAAPNPYNLTGNIEFNYTVSNLAPTSTASLKNEIYNSSNTLVWSSQTEATENTLYKLSWNGLSSQNVPVNDGIYKFMVSGMDNATEHVIDAVSVSFEVKKNSVQSNDIYISDPLASVTYQNMKVKFFWYLGYYSPTGNEYATINMSVYNDATNQKVKEWSPLTKYSGANETTEWVSSDGKSLPDGVYRFEISGMYKGQPLTKKIVKFEIKPKIEDFPYFSNPLSNVTFENKKALFHWFIAYYYPTGSDYITVNMAVYDEATNQKVKEWASFTAYDGANRTTEWTTADGKPLPNGVYRFELNGTYKGQSLEKKFVKFEVKPKIEDMPYFSDPLANVGFENNDASFFWFIAYYYPTGSDYITVNMAVYDEATNQKVKEWASFTAYDGANRTTEWTTADGKPFPNGVYRFELSGTYKGQSLEKKSVLFEVQGDSENPDFNPQDYTEISDFDGTFIYTILNNDNGLITNKTFTYIAKSVFDALPDDRYITVDQGIYAKTTNKVYATWNVEINREFDIKKNVSSELELLKPGDYYWKVVVKDGATVLDQKREDFTIKALDIDNPTSQVNFTDIGTHWAKIYINQLKEKCQIYGYKDAAGNYLNIFKPDFKISRYELAAMIAKCKYGADLPAVTSSPFPDMDVTHWAAPAVKKAFDDKIIAGYKDGTFRGNATATRAEALAIVIRAYFSEAEIASALKSNICTDIDQSLWYANIFNFALENGIIEGTKNEDDSSTGKCLPINDITRAENSKILIRASDMGAFSSPENGFDPSSPDLFPDQDTDADPDLDWSELFPDL